MREILFRGKRLGSFLTGKWICGNLEWHQTYEERFRKKDVDDVVITKPISNFITEKCRVDPNTVGQYVGLRDKNGTKIFEGDIVRVSKFRTLGKNNVSVFHEPFNLEVLFFNGGFFFSTKNDIEKMFGLPIVEYDADNKDGDSIVVEVIGNIHDNKELLETGTPLKRRFMQKQ